LAATLLLLSAMSQVALTGLCFAVEQVCEDSHNVDAAQRNGSRVRFFKEDFCQQHSITDTCMLNVESYQEATLIFTMFTTFLALCHTLDRMPNPNLALQCGKIDNKINQVLKKVKCLESMPNHPLTVDMVLYQLLQVWDG
jgi:hypothetical protein